MGKNKKEHSKKGEASKDLLEVAALSVKKFRKVTKQIRKLSTGQKVVGGIALLAAGLTYLAKNRSEADEAPALPSAEARPDHAETEPFADEAVALGAAEGHRKSRKSPKAKQS